MIKKAAKTLSVCVVALAVITAVVVTGWYVHAQESQPQQPNGATLDLNTFDGCKQQGKQLEAAGDYESAITWFQRAKQIQRDETVDREIGKCLQAQGKYAEALDYYEQALANPITTHGEMVLDGDAWYGAAVCYEELGDSAKVQATVQKLKDIAPISEWTFKVMGIQAEMEGKPATEVQAMMTREMKAADLYRQARDLARNTQYKSSEPLPLCDQVLADYPDTMGAFSALSLKAELLWHLKMRDDMCTCYAKMREILKQQPSSEKVRLMLRTMDARIAQHRTGQLLEQIEQEVNAGRKVDGTYWDRLNDLLGRWRPNTDDSDSILVYAGSLLKQQCFRKRSHELVAPSAFQQVRDVCQTVLAMQINQRARMETQTIVIQSFHLEGNYPATLQSSEDFLAQFSNPQDLNLFHHEVTVAHYLAADALCRLNRFGDSLVHLRWLLADQPPAYNDGMHAAIQYLYCYALLQTKAPQEDLDREVGILRTRFPGSSFVQLMDIMISQEVTSHDQ